MKVEEIAPARTMHAPIQAQIVNGRGDGDAGGTRRVHDIASVAPLDFAADAGQIVSA
jgi:hypothetical protein